MPKLIPALCMLTALGCLGASSLPAETIYALSYSIGPLSLLSFDSATPSVITKHQPITGLLGNPTGIAFRPADGQLYAEIGYQFYRIDPTTAKATLLFSNPALGNIGTAAMAFNPVTGLLRVIGTPPDRPALSFRVNVDTGAVLQDGQSIQPSGLAYTNNYAGANTTTLYALSGGSLLIDNPENQSQFTRVGSLGVPGATTGPAASDLSISGLTGTAYASLALSTGPGPYDHSSQFYTVDLSTGAGTLVGLIGDGTLDVEAIAAPVGPSQAAPVPEPTSWALLGAGLLLGGAVRRFRPRNGTASVLSPR